MIIQPDPKWMRQDDGRQHRMANLEAEVDRLRADYRSLLDNYAAACDAIARVRELCARFHGRCSTCGHIDGEAVNVEIQLSLRDAWIAGFVGAKMGEDVHRDNPYPREQRGGEPR